VSSKGRDSQIAHNRRYRAIKRGEIKPHEYTMTVEEAITATGIRGVS
jgi:hypothetical protein